MSVQGEATAQAVVWLADIVARKGWLPATSGNLSVLDQEDPLVFGITRSGADKTRLTTSDVLFVDADCRPVDATSHRPSAETGVHAKLYAKLPCKSILHVHTMFNNLLSQAYYSAGSVRFFDHELLKALDHWEEHASIQLPIVENHHNLQQLAEAVEQAAQPDVPGVLVRNHGIYAWGDSPESALRHLEAFEFLCEYQFRWMQWKK